MISLNRSIAVENFLGIDGFDIYWYGILIAVGFLLAFLLYSYFAKKRNYPKDLPGDALIIAMLCAVVGARLYYVAFEWNLYYVKGDFLATLKNIADIRSGGLAIYGGVIAAILGLTVYSLIKKINPLKIIDLAAAPLALGQAIGRWGNFFNQEAHGALVTDPKLQFFPYAVMLDSPKGGDPAGWYQATFFYESLWCLLICVFLVLTFKKQKYSGQAMLTYFALYGFERGIVEWLRTDQLTVGNVPISAMLSLVLCAVSVALLIIAKVKNYTTPVYWQEASPADTADNGDADTTENAENGEISENNKNAEIIEKAENNGNSKNNEALSEDEQQ